MTTSTSPSLQPPIQTIVTGTEKARAAFHLPLTGPLQVHEQCIVVDLPLLETLPQHKTARLIAVVTNAAELYTATRHRPKTLAIVAICDLEESIRIRHAALHSLSAPGILLVRKGDRARDVFSRVVRAWRAGEGEGRAWGEATLAEAADAVVPPAWDSDGKISAVVDAATLKLDQILSESSWGSVVAGKTLDLGDGEALQKEAVVERDRANKKSEKWIKRIQQISKAHNRSPSSNAESVSEDASTGHEQLQSDFFQRLLAGAK